MTKIGNLYILYNLWQGLRLKGLGNSNTFYRWSAAIKFGHYKSWLRLLFCIVFDHIWRQLQYFTTSSADEWFQSTVYRFKLCSDNFLISNIWSEEYSIILTSSSEHTVHILLYMTLSFQLTHFSRRLSPFSLIDLYNMTHTSGAHRQTWYKINHSIGDFW